MSFSSIGLNGIYAAKDHSPTKALFQQFLTAAIYFWERNVIIGLCVNFKQSILKYAVILFVYPIHKKKCLQMWATWHLWLDTAS